MGTTICVARAASVGGWQVISRPSWSSSDTWTPTHFVFEARYAGRNFFTEEMRERTVRGERVSSCGEAIHAQPGSSFEILRSGDVTFSNVQIISEPLQIETARDVFKSVSDGAFDKWIADHNYDPAKVQKLRDIENGLDPRRVAWLMWRHRQGDVRIRLFDASPEVYIQGHRWEGVSKEGLMSPMERKDPQLVLPWSALRNNIPGRFVFELGVLNQDLDVIGGVPAVFHAVAAFLDMKVFARIYGYGAQPRFYDQNDGVIQITARPANARLYERHGFAAVVVDGRELKTFDGMLVMTANLRDFISRYIQRPSDPRTRE